MKKIELTFEDVEKRILPNGMLPVDAKWIEAIVVNANSFLDRKHLEQYACSQVEWFKLSEKKPDIGHLIVCTYEGKDSPEVIQFHEQWGHGCQNEIYWMPCPKPPEFDSHCVKELQKYLDSCGTLIDKSYIVQIVKRHEKKEEE